MPQHRVIDFLSDMASAPKRRGDMWDEVGRAIEAGYRAPLPIDLSRRLAIVIILMLPLFLARLAEGALPALMQTVQTFLVQTWAN